MNQDCAEHVVVTKHDAEGRILEFIKSPIGLAVAESLKAKAYVERERKAKTALLRESDALEEAAESDALQAAENSTRRLGHEEAINCLSRALAILDSTGTAGQDPARITFLRQRSWARRSAGDLAGSVDDLRQVIALTAAAGELRP